MTERFKESLDWPYNYSGCRVDFTKGLPLAWGIEIDLPFDNMMKIGLSERHGIKIPQRIKKFKYLTLSPQESLPKNLRNIESIHPEDTHTSLENLANMHVSKRASFYRRKEIENGFFSVFAKNFREIRKFNQLIAKSRGDTILMAEGHGFDSPFSLGEQDKYDPFNFPDLDLQKEGNTVEGSSIIKKYNNPEVFGALIFVVCYDGQKKVRALDIPLAYGVGEIGSAEARKGLVETVVVAPRKKTEK